MNRSRIASVATSLLVATSLACGDAREAAPVSAAPAAALRTTSLSDTFNAYDSSVWQMASWANGSPFNCGFAADHVTFSGGAMTLKLDNTPSSGKSYSGGEYRTIDTFSYGRFETRMKAAKGSGIVSSFFTYTGTPWDEIDFEVLGKNTSQVQLNYYVNGTGGHERMIDLGFDASAAYHTYAIDWQPNSISWYVDGVLKHTVTGSPSTLPSHPMQIMMNLWNGIGVDSWLGSFNYSGPLYASYDSVTYTPPGASTYALDVSRTGRGSGTVTSNTGGIACGGTCSATYTSGTTVTLTAAPDTNSTFGGWSGACTGTSTTCVVSMTAARSVTATFNGVDVTTYDLGVSKSGSGSGTVTSNPGGISCGGTCSATYASGTAVTLTATPDAGFAFAGWSGACTGTGSCIVSMTAARSVGASFILQQQGGPISINVGGSAVGSFVADLDFSGGSTYSTTTAIDTSLLASPVPPQSVLQTERYGEFTYTIPGFTPGSAQAVTLYFVESYWTAAGRRTFNVAINGATVLTAFDIYAAAGGQNKAIARTFDTTASAAGQVVIAFTKGGGPDNPKVDGIAVAAGSPQGTSYTLTIEEAGTGSGTVAGGSISCTASCATSLASGTVVTLNATPATGSTFGGWSGACSGTGACVVTMDAAKAVTATFNGTPVSDCTALSGGQSGNFNTTGTICYTVNRTINGWGCSNVDGRTVTVNGTAVTCGKLPLPGSAPYTFSFSGGTYPWASFYFW